VGRRADGGIGVRILLHGNPTWSFLYRDVIAGLRDRYRCVAIDYPGFGLSHAAPGYGYVPAEHADVVEALIVRLDRRGATLMVQAGVVRSASRWRRGIQTGSLPS
jgi:pimeloyl-ACP methyl ester carboxylesterase